MTQLIPFLMAKKAFKAAAVLLLSLCCNLSLQAQQSGAEGAFHAAANQFIAGQQQEALQTVEQGLRRYPNDAKLQALHQKLQQQQQQNKNKDQQNKEEQDQQSQEQQQSAGGEQSEEDLNQQGEQKEQQSDQQKQQQQPREAGEGEEGEEQEVQPLDPQGEVEKRLQEMNISPEKAKMMLEAMKSNEIQYLQQKQRQPARRQKSDKPDW